jgi:hypothetical protein
MGLKHPDVYGGELIIFWHEFEPAEGQFDWDRVQRDMDLWHAAGKKLDIRLSTAHIGPNFTPSWVFNNHQVRRVGRGVFEDFESDTLRYELGPAASIAPSTHADHPGERLLEVRNDTATPQLFLSLPATKILQPQATYSIQWDMLATDRAKGTLQLLATNGDLLGETPFGATRDGWNIGSVELTIPEGRHATLRWIADAQTHFHVDNINLIRVDEFIPHHGTDFEDGWNDWLPTDASEITSERPVTMQGARSLRAIARTPGFHPILRNNPARFPLGQGDGVQVRFQAFTERDCIVRLRVMSPEFPNGEIYDDVREVVAGSPQRVAFFCPEMLPTSDCEIVIGIDGPGEILIDEIERRNWAEHIAVFPDYFSPDFMRLWTRAVESFAERFGSHPALGIVSVSGFGRWEEVMLDEDIKGILDDQWRARGFTQERFLAHIEDCMDLHRDLLPGVPLRICLAYGLELANDVDWVYRRVAQAAVRRGIGLKQNGLSEKYDTWNDNTSTSYLYSRYRDNEAVSLTHETGGQIYRNLLDAHGYPLSLLNRTIANHTEYLFLYKPDIFGRNINRYFDNFAERARRHRPTTFYTWLGDYSLVNEHSPVPVAFRNQWLGVRQFNAPGSEPQPATVAGEKTLQTTPTNRGIVFDVDDRFQYHGMFGAELCIDYYDAPAGPFQVRVYDNTTDRWRSLGTVQRTGEQAFRRAFFHDSTWCRSRRNTGEDVHADIAIEELTGAPLAVRNLELQFIPATDLARTPALITGRGTRGVLAQPTLTHLIPPIDGDHSLGALSFRVHAPSLNRNNLIARLFARDPHTQREQMLVEKEYTLPADGDEVTLPFVAPTFEAAYRLDLTALEGEVGWFINHEGTPDLTLWSYSSKEPTPTLSDVDFKLLEQAESLEASFIADQPIHSVSIAVAPQPTQPAPRMESRPAVVEVTIDRLLPENQGRSRLVDAARYDVTESRILTIPIEPQPPGQFAVRVTAHWQRSQVGLRDGHLFVHPSNASFSVPLREPRVLDKLPQQILQLPPTAWSIRNGLLIQADSNDTREFHVTGFEPTLEVSDLSIDANPRQRFVLRFANRTGANMARLFWADDRQEFSAERSTFIPLVPNDAFIRDHPVEMGGIASWQGRITRLRLQPATGSTRHGFLTLADLRLEQSEAVTQLDFRNPLDSLWPAQGVSLTARTEEGILFTLDKSPARLHVPADDFNVEAEPHQTLVLRMRNNSSATTARVAWATLARTNLDLRHAFANGTAPAIDFAIRPASEAVQELRVDLSGNPDWRGHVVSLVLFPALEAKPGETVLVESLAIVTGTSAPATGEAP